MATPQRAVRGLPVTGPNGGYSLPQGVDAPDIDDADLMAVESWDAPNVTASVYRRHPIPPGMPSNKALYCGKHPTPCDVDVLRESYGGGLYSVLFTDQNGRRVGQKTIAIEGPQKVIGIDTKAPLPQQQQPYPMLYSPPVQPQDPTLIAILDRMDRLTQAVLQQQQVPQSSTIDRLNEMKTMAEVMKSLNGTPTGSDPGEYARWMRTGFNLAKELEGGGSSETNEPSWVKPVVEAIPQVLDFIDRRASAAARGASSSAPRRIVGPPSLPKPGIRTSAPNAPQAVAAGGQDESAAGLPKWILATAREFIREIKQETNDAEYMAAWISRNVPHRVIEGWSKQTPSVARAEIMRLAPIVQKAGGVTLSEDFVTNVVRALLMDDEPETASVIDVEPLAATSVTLGNGTVGGAVSEPIGDAPANVRFDEDEDEDDDDDDDDEDDESEDDEDEEDDDDDDLELKSQEESGPKG